MDENQTNRIKQVLLKIGHLVGLFIAMAIICLPGLWIVLSSLRPTVEIMAKPPVWIPHELNFDAYVAMFSGVGSGGIPVIAYFHNSIIIAVTSTVIALAIGLAGGYAFARYRFRGKTAIFLGFMLTRTVPAPSARVLTASTESPSMRTLSAVTFSGPAPLLRVGCSCHRPSMAASSLSWGAVGGAGRFGQKSTNQPSLLRMTAVTLPFTRAKSPTLAPTRSRPPSSVASAMSARGPLEPAVAPSPSAANRSGARSR